MLKKKKSQSSSKQGAEKNPGNSDHTLTLHHQRLYHALSIGLRSCGDKGRKWHSSDIETQRLVLRSIYAFLDCISAETLQHPLVKESVGDMVGALEGILQFTNEATLSLLADVAVKMVDIVPTLVMQSYVLDLVRALTTLLTSHHLRATVSCATALELIISNLNSKIEGEVWEIMKKTNTVIHIVNNIRGFSNGTTPIEYYLKMVSLLSKILRRWQPSRFIVWSDAKLMEVLGVISLDPDISVKFAVLRLYSALALCGNGAQKLLENAESVLPIMVLCMDRSNSVSVQLEGFELARCLTMNERGCSKMMAFCCEPISIAIVEGMRSWGSLSGKIPKDLMCLLTAACRLALITRWAGEHHKYFWKLGIDRVLLKLLLNDFDRVYSSRHYLEKIVTAEHGLRENYLIVLRPFIWDILGGLAAHCLKDFNPNMHGDELCMDFLIICVCLAFVDSFRQLGQNDISHVCQYESATRTVLMMIYSSSSYIGSRTIFFLSEILKPNGKEYLKRLLDKLSQHRNKQDTLQTVIDLMSLTCYSGLCQYRDYIIKRQGISMLLGFVKWCLTNNVHMRRASVAPHLYSSVLEKTCCWDHTEDWDGDDMPLLFSLWGLSELMHQSSCVKTHLENTFGQVNCNETEIVTLLQGICRETSASGPRWYAAYILSNIGRYGFPSKMGKRIGKVLDDKEFADLVFTVTNEEPLTVHSVILKVRCPPLLPRSVDKCFVRQDGEKCERPRKEFHLKSDKVDRKALLKLLEFVYSGHLQVGEELVEKLRGIARHCNLQHLLRNLSKENPVWGTPFPTFDLSFALEPAGHHLSDIALVAEGADIIDWTCHTCSISVPHMHVHRAILSSSSTYFQSMFRSGMQESHSETIKAPVSWEALVKVVKWFYSDELPKPICGCSWDNFDIEEKLNELIPFVELCWLAKYWCLGDDLHDYCTRVIISRLDSTRRLSVKLIQIAASLLQKKLVEVVANYMAPLYNHLCKSGELDEVDDELVDMVRAASVRLFQEGGRSLT